MQTQLILIRARYSQNAFSAVFKYVEFLKNLVIIILDLISQEKNDAWKPVMDAPRLFGILYFVFDNPGIVLRGNDPDCIFFDINGILLSGIVYRTPLVIPRGYIELEVYRTNHFPALQKELLSGKCRNAALIYTLYTPRDKKTVTVIT